MAQIIIQRNPPGKDTFITIKGKAKLHQPCQLPMQLVINEGRDSADGLHMSWYCESCSTAEPVICDLGVIS